MTDDQQQPRLEDAALALYYHAAEMIKAGKTAQEIKSDLIRKGVRPETAQLMLERLDKSRDNVALKYARRRMITGSVMCFVGVVLGLGLFGDGSNLPAMLFSLGVVVFGVFWLLGGVAQYVQLRDTDDT